MHKRANGLGGGLYWVFVVGLGGLALAYMTLPVGIALVMSFTDGQTLRFPPQGLSVRWYRALLDPVLSAQEHLAAYNSIKIAALAVAGSIVFAVPAAVGMMRLPRRAAGALEVLFVSPLVLPSLIYGLAALVAATLIGIPPSLGLVVAGHIVIFGPLMYRACAAIAARIDPSLEQASATLGASALTTLRRVTLPLLWPGILAGSFLVFMQSLDNVSISLFLADPATTILPLRMFALIEQSLDVRVAALSGLLIAATLVTLVLARRMSQLFRIWR
jgi:putative spermidine/putrescine transport system permease protein